MTEMTPEHARAELARLKGKGLDNVIKNALRRGAARVKKDAMADIGSRGIGRRIWGKNSKGLKKVLRTGRVEKDGPGGFAITLTARGIPAMIETGGKIAAHVIKAFRRGPTGKRLLSFRKSGGSGAVPEVQHPGARVPRRPWIQPALDRHVSQTERDIVAAVDVYSGMF